jgi:hypothetical protein
MDFFNSAVDVLQMLVIAIGAGLAIWGVINLLEGYGQDNPASKSQGMKQLMAGGGIALIGLILVPLLTGVFDMPTTTPTPPPGGGVVHFFIGFNQLFTYVFNTVMIFR